MKRSAIVGMVTLCGVLAILSFSWKSWGRSGGAGMGFSGGPANSGRNCTACHDFHQGPGGVELTGTPQRYRPNTVYDLTVRIFDVQQEGAGFELSAENLAGHQGTFLLTDAIRTKTADGNPAYATHTAIGYLDSRGQWTGNGGSYSYSLQWQAPSSDVGRITFFTAGNAVANMDPTMPDLANDRYYAAHTTIDFARAGDADGDTDIDLADFATFQRCFNGNNPPIAPGCEFVDLNDDALVSLDDLSAFAAHVGTSGPVAAFPAGYVLADVIRGGRLYDRWWTVIGAAAPAADHPLWALRPDLLSNPRSGADTWRCKECHGWDYKGVSGAYAAGDHRTGFPGIGGTTRSAQEIFELLKAAPTSTFPGHDFAAAGMSDRDIWDVVKMTLEGVVDTDLFIGACDISRTPCSADAECPTGNVCDLLAFGGTQSFGNVNYSILCSSCHDPIASGGPPGTAINFATPANPEYVGTIAGGDPWEFFHKVRFGHPASPMPSMDLLGFTLQDAADLGAYAATLPR